MLNLSAPKRARWKMASLILALVAWSCGSVIAVYNQKAYENATTLKAEASALMDQATQPFADHADEVRALITRLDAAYEYAKGIPKNNLTAEQWRKLNDSSGGLLGGFFKLWKEQGKFTEMGLQASRKNVVDAFDEIIKLETAKLRI